MASCVTCLLPLRRLMLHSGRHTCPAHAQTGTLAPMAYSYVHASGGGGRQASSQVAAPPPPGSKDTHARKKIYSTATPSTNHRGKDVGQGRGGSGGGSNGTTWAREVSALSPLTVSPRLDSPDQSPPATTLTSSPTLSPSNSLPSSSSPDLSLSHMNTITSVD
mmetsp:Transcript_39016/g.98342  ORF Transcript_39016/g.98342 Transcript_39016/m.98342 type:complete len:163 (+) Transcript_39016:314-802(+)